uniref:Dimethylargininase n=1 Tax=Romanomermis culicivorax TaxID=13658 RepID=A0A915I3N8_ROMCU
MSRWTDAIVVQLPNNLTNDGHCSKIDLQRAKKEQQEMCEILRHSGVNVFELSPEENAPAATLLVEDVAVVCNGTALLAKPGHSSRRREILAIIMELGFYIIDLAQHPESSKILLEGSDVLFTGREFFVGIGKKTNVAGAMEVARAFPEYSVTPVKVNGPHHLKYYVCLAAPNVLSVGQCKEAQNILKRIEREATFRYQTLTFNDENVVNCINANGSLLYRPEFHGSLEKFGLLQDTKLNPVAFTELSKIGMLSQQVLLLRKLKIFKNL